MTVKTSGTLTQQHLIGKLCFFDEKYSDKKLACLVYWQDDKPMMFQMDVRMLKNLFAPHLFEKIQENNFIMECDASVDENKTLNDIEITSIFEIVNPINDML